MYRFMNEEEIEIRQINDLKMLHLYQLGGSDALAVYYGKDKEINLCAMDTNYPILMEKALQLYSQCKNKESIIMDADTQRLFEEGVNIPNYHTSFFHKIGKQYLNMEGALSPKFASGGIMRESLLPMLKYYLTQLYHMWNINIVFEPDAKGWQGNCVLKIRKEKDTFLLPVRMRFNGNECKVSIGNFMQDLCNIEFEISYREDRIYVLFECRDMQFFGESHFELKHPDMNAYTTIRVGGKIAYHQEEPIELLTVQDQTLHDIFKEYSIPSLMEEKFSQVTVCKLPWGGYLISHSLETVKEQLKRTDFNIMYIELYRQKMTLRQYSHSLVENLSDGLKLRTDGAVMRKLYYGDRKKEVETLFMPVGYYSGWDYKEYLEDKYFYHEMEEQA